MFRKGLKLLSFLTKSVVAIVFLSFILLQSAVFLAQHYPHKVSGWINQYSPYSFFYQQGNIQQGWTSFHLSFKGVSLKHATWQVTDADIDLDVNLFALMNPAMAIGQQLRLEHARIVLPDTFALANHDSKSSINFVPPRIKKLWQRVVLEDIQVQQNLKQTALFFWVKNLESRLGAIWVIQGEFGVDNQPFLKTHSSKSAALVSFNALLQPSFLGIPDQGNLRWTTLQPFSNHLIRAFVSDQQSTMLPVMKLSFDGEAYLKNGQWRRINARFNVQQIHWLKPKQDQVLPKSLGFDIEWRSGAGQSFALKNLRIEQHHITPKALAEVNWQQGRWLTFRMAEFNAKPIVPLLQKALTVYMGIPEKQWQQAPLAIKIHALSGRVNLQNLRLESLSAQIPHLSFPESKNFPGISLRQLAILLIEEGWQITLTKPMMVAYQKAFESPLKIQFPKPILVENKIGSSQFKIDRFPILVNDVALETQIGAGGLHQVQASLHAKADQIQQVKNVLPYRLMSPSLQHWLKTALVSGKNIRLKAQLSGDLSQFPFKKGGGHLDAEADIAQTTLKFQSDWPALKNADVHLKFVPYDLTITSPQAELMGIQAKNIYVSIPRLDEKNIALRFSGIAKGDASQAQKLLLVSPLAEKIGLKTLLEKDAVLEGPLQVKLKHVWIPLLGFEKKKEKIKVDVQFQGVNLTLYQALAFKDVRGIMKIRNQQVESRQLVGTLTGEPFEVSLHTNTKQQQLEINGKGVWQPPEHQDLLHGYINWRHNAVIPFQKGYAITMTTQLDLKSLHSFLPAPLDQSSIDKKTLKVSYQQGEKNAQIQATLPGLFSLDGVIKADKQHPVEKMVVALGQQKRFEATENLKGIQVKGLLPKVDMDQWLKIWPKIEALVPHKQSSDIELDWQPSKIELEHLVFKQYDYGQSVLRWQNISQQQLTLSAQNSEMQLKALKQNDKWSVQIDKLHVHTEKETSQPPVKQKCGSPPSRIEYPKISLKGKNIQWEDKHFDHIETKVLPFEKVLVAAPIRIEKGRAKGVGEYVWTLDDNKSRLHIKLSAPRVEDLTAMIAIEKGLKGKKGVVESRIEWNGGPDCFSLASIKGRVTIRLDDGVIKEVEPGVARLLGLLSIESLARRLKLDLSDVTEEGLAYSIIEGTGRLRNGVFGIESFRLVAPSAEAKLFGNINLIDKKFDLRADVTPAIGSSIATIAAIVGAANPITAVLTYALLKNIPEINENLITYHYRVTGPWEKPRIKEKGGGVELIQTPN